VIAGLVTFSARGRPEFAGIANDLRDRITALGRAHDFVRPHSAQSRPVRRQDSLMGLLDELFAPYQEKDAPRLMIEGDDVMIDDRSATPLALLFHELATNAAKYGALSVPDGRVTVTAARDGETTVLSWIEQGGPVVTQPPQVGGFGTQLIELSAVRQLGGKVDRDWRREGLQVTIRTPHSAMTR
jgi:two-component sensor histidine kinase